MILARSDFTQLCGSRWRQDGWLYWIHGEQRRLNGWLSQAEIKLDFTT